MLPTRSGAQTQNNLLAGNREETRILGTVNRKQALTEREREREREGGMEGEGDLQVNEFHGDCASLFSWQGHD